MGYQDARSLVGGLFRDARRVDSPATTDDAPVLARGIGDELSPEEIASYCDAALDAANRSLAEAVQRLSDSSDEFDQWFPRYSAQAAASRRASRDTSRDLDRALARWEIGRDARK